ncbi:MAG: hypothetical protein RR239_06665, partial [Oscillospiraceae bacterium]
EKKSCQTNQSTIKSNIANYSLMGGTDGTSLTWAVVASDVKAATPAASAKPSSMPSNGFAKMFDGSALPQCPSMVSGAENYKITIDSTKANEFTVACEAKDGTTLIHPAKN